MENTGKPGKYREFGLLWKIHGKSYFFVKIHGKYRESILLQL